MSIQIKDQSKLDNLHNLYLRDFSEKISATIKEDQELSYCMGYDAGVRVTCENFQTQLAEAKRANETLNKELIESKDYLYTKQLEWARESNNLRFSCYTLREELLKTDTQLNSTCLLLAEFRRGCGAL